MSPEDRQEASAQVPHGPPSGQGGSGGAPRTLVDDVVPLGAAVSEDLEEQLARERTERRDMVGGSHRPRLPRLRFRPPARGRMLLIGSAALAISVALPMFVLADRGSDPGGGPHHSAASPSHGPLLARSPKAERAPQAQAAHTRRREALRARRKAARRRADHQNRPRHKAEASRATSSAPVTEAQQSTAGYTEDESVASEYTGAEEEAYEPPPPPEASPTPEEAAASEFNFESQQP